MTIEIVKLAEAMLWMWMILVGLAAIIWYQCKRFEKRDRLPPEYEFHPDTQPKENEDVESENLSKD